MMLLLTQANDSHSIRLVYMGRILALFKQKKTPHSGGVHITLLAIT
ncbi:hypothetical protein PSM_A2004 [Pseudoalteromonas sp. SM9913]|nr:hypothetical protein PSM_A2004 [Pseudoalteromonas sp. SM9913]